jgi:hypothetical protein
MRPRRSSIAKSACTDAHAPQLSIERSTAMSPVMTDPPLDFVNYGTNGEKSKSSRGKTASALSCSVFVLPLGQSLLPRHNRRRRSISKSRLCMKSVDAFLASFAIAKSPRLRKTARYNNRLAQD